MEIDYINGAINEEMCGVSKYQYEIHKRIKNIKINKIEYDPGHFVLNNINVSNLLKLYLWYPLIVKTKVKPENIKHITSQNIGFLSKLFQKDTCILTCYDLIPLVYEETFSSKFNLKGLKRAGRIITISDFSKKEIIKYTGCPDNKIDVVYPAVDHEYYYKTGERRILEDLNIPEDSPVVIYIGSEQPRQNVPNIIKAFSKAKKRIPNLKLVKIGRPQFYGARKNIMKLIDDLELNEEVYFINYVSEEDLPKWYNAADVLVYPCEYAGFGLPPLEAMACGTPVITSNTTSLPEVVGDAGIMINPHDIDLMSDMIYKVITDTEFKNKLVRKGIERSKFFNWEESARRTEEIYKNFQ